MENGRVTTKLLINLKVFNNSNWNVVYEIEYKNYTTLIIINTLKK
jgi:hypothetical protein